MPNRRIIDGKTTPERIAEELERLQGLPPEERRRITVDNFAVSVGISPHTFKHKYHPEADRVRAMRDADRGRPRRRSHVTRSRAEKGATDLAEARAVVSKQQEQMDQLTIAITKMSGELEKAEGRARRVTKLEKTNERLRGVVIFLQQAIYRNLPPERSHQIFEEMEEQSS